MYEPKYRITPYLLNLIDRASGLKAWIDSAALKVRWLPALQKEARVRSTHSSTAIEGNPLTLSEVQMIEKGAKVNSSKNDEKEVSNYLIALKWVEKQKTTAINENDILTLHRLITEGILQPEKTGHYKDKQNYIIDEKGIRIFTPPPPKETPKLITDLLAWLNSSKTTKLHSTLVCAIFHHRFVSIHPFSDGNGRVARALGTLILYKRGFDTNHILSLDDYFSNERKRYYQKIQQARELDYDLTLWIEYVAEAVVFTLENTIRRIESLQVSSINSIEISPSQEKILRVLRDRPSVRGAELIKELKVSRARVNQIITPLIKTKLVIKEGSNKGTKYRLAL